MNQISQRKEERRAKERVARERRRALSRDFYMPSDLCRVPVVVKNRFVFEKSLIFPQPRSDQNMSRMNIGRLVITAY